MQANHMFVADRICVNLTLQKALQFQKGNAVTYASSVKFEYPITSSANRKLESQHNISLADGRLGIYGLVYST